MKIQKKILIRSLLFAMMTMVIVPLTASCNRLMTYEDGMFDYNEVYDDDATNDTFQLNSEIENDDQERY